MKKVVTNLPHLKEMFDKWQTNLYGNAWHPIYWLNHDQPRVMSQYGNVEKTCIIRINACDCTLLYVGYPIHLPRRRNWDDQLSI